MEVYVIDLHRLPLAGKATIWLLVGSFVVK